VLEEYRAPDEIRGTILDDIVHAKLHEILSAKRKVPAAVLEAALDRAPEVRSLKVALRRRSPAIIAEIKRASPSAGLLRPDLDASKIALEYEKASAAAVSVVTEGSYFQGSLELLASLRWSTALPLLRKDFIIDLYQIVEARHAGADSVLLIAALLPDPALRRFRAEAERLGMDAVVEVHNESELERSLEAGASIVGVNNRDLRTFEVSLETSLRLAPRIPKSVVALSESGIRSNEDLRKLAQAGYQAFLVGEQLMRAASPGAALRELVTGRSAAAGGRA
jgi:indole-3-glycerol phosphate synthase